MQVEGEIFCQFFLIEDIFQESLVAFAQNDIMVFQLGVEIAFLCTEIYYKERHAILSSLNFFVGVLFALAFRNHMPVGKGYIRIRHHRVSPVFGTPFQANSFCRPVFNKDLIDFRAFVNLPALLTDEFFHSIHNGTGSAHGVVYAPLALEIMNHGVDGGSLKWIAANQQRVEGETLSQEIILYKLGSVLIDRFI